MRLRFPRRFPPTREGWWFLVATLLVGAAAVNGGINLLFLIFGMMLFLILASGVMSELALKGLAVSRRMPSALHARTPFLMGIAVRNDKRRLPTFSLEVEDLLAGRPVDRRCYYLKLPAGRTQETAYRHTLPRRGVYRITGFRLSTRFPFGLIRKSRDIEAPAELLVYPALVPVPESWLPAAAALEGRRQETRASRRGDFRGLRPYRPSDDPRDIHWKLSARRGEPVVRESEEDTGRAVVIALENETVAAAAAPESLPPLEEGTTRSGPRNQPPFEAAVSLAASVAVTLLKRGLHVGLATHEGFIPPAHGPSQNAAILKALALVEPRPGAAPALPGGVSLPIVRVRAGAGGARLEGADGTARAASTRAALGGGGGQRA